MATILLTWELGGGWGHLMTLRPIAKALAAEGHRVFAALRDLSRALPVFGNDVTLLQAPFSLRSGPFEIDKPTTAALILINNGFGEVGELGAHCQAWHGIFDYVKPDLMICDHSPTALLASRGRPFKRCIIGTGFCCPPDECPLPNLRSWVPHDPAILLRDEEKLLQTMNARLKLINAPTLSHVARLYAEVDETFLTTIRELDHYPGRARAEYWGDPTLPEGQAALWPDDVAGPKVFAYLKSFASQAELLGQLNEWKLPTLIYADGIDENVIRQFTSPTVQFASGQVNLLEAGRQCDLAILHGTHGSTLSMLLAGKPILQIPISLEQVITAQAVRHLGAGLCAPIRNSSQMIDDLRSMMESDHYALAARCFAETYANVNSAESGKRILDRLNGMLEASL